MGTDTISLSQNFSYYLFSNLNHSKSSVTISRPDLKLSAYLTSIEKFVFKDKTISFSDILPDPNNVATGTAIIQGILTWGTTLSITNTIKDIDGLDTFSYKWQNDNGPLSTNTTYKLAETDVGKKVWVTVSYTDKKGNIEEVASKPVDVTISTKPSAVNDILIGTDKTDKLSGLAGNDTLIGGLGSDKLTGGKGSDIFAFSNSDFYTKNSDGNLVFNKAIDTITDFNLKEHDLLDFGDLGELTFYPTLNAAQQDIASLFYVKATGKIYLNTNDTDGFTPSAIIIISGKPAINTDMSDWNYPA